jgi:hypothetical protein
MSAAAIFVAFVRVEPGGQALLTGAPGRWYFGIMVQPPNSVARTRG